MNETSENFYKKHFLNSLRPTIFERDETRIREQNKLVDLLIENIDKINWENVFEEIKIMEDEE